MITPSLLLMPTLPLSTAQRIIPNVPKKLIRNLTDREIIILTGSRDPRLYTLLNCMELALLHLLSLTETNFSVGKLMCRGLLSRVEQRCENGTIGTDSDMQVMAAVITKNEDGGFRLNASFRAPEAIGSVIQDWNETGFRDSRVIAIDSIIEDVLSLYMSIRSNNPPLD